MPRPPTEPQQARAAQTRARLLDVTVRCLAERGYAGTSTQEVCRRAGVSRGALQFHFRTRDQLLIASLERILEDRVADFVAARRSEGPQPPVVLLRKLWAQWQGPAYTAWLELAVAARTHPELRAPMKVVMERFDAAILAAMEELLPPGTVPPEWMEGVAGLVFAIFNGLAVSWGYRDDSQEAPVLALLELLAAGAVGDEA